MKDILSEWLVPVWKLMISHLDSPKCGEPSEIVVGLQRTIRCQIIRHISNERVPLVKIKTTLCRAIIWSKTLLFWRWIWKTLSEMQPSVLPGFCGWPYDNNGSPKYVSWPLIVTSSVKNCEQSVRMCRDCKYSKGISKQHLCEECPLGMYVLGYRFL